MFDSWNKHLFKKKVNHTEFILGWLPLGGYVKPLGMEKDKGDIDTLLPEERIFALSHKPKYQQMIFRMSQYAVWPVLFVIFMININNDNGFRNNFSLVFDFAKESTNAMFGIISKDEFSLHSSKIVSNYSLLPFTLLIGSLIFIISSLAAALSQYLTDERNNRAVKLLGGMLTLTVGYIVLWKIPSFALSFFSWSEIFKYILSILLGFYAAGVVCYCLMVPVIHLNRTT